MKKLLYLQNNTFESAHTLEYIVELSRYMNMELKIIHIQFPDAIVVSHDPRNQLFQTPIDYVSNNQKHIDSTTRNIEVLKRAGIIKDQIPFEYYTGMPSSILSYLYDTGYFDMLVLENENTKVSIYPYQSIKEIIQSVKCPIWIIPRDKKFTIIKDIAYMTDYQPQDVNAIGFLAKQFKNHISSIKTIHLSSKNDFEEEIMRRGFEEILKDRINKNNTKSIVCSHDKKFLLPQMIDLCIGRENPDLVVALKDNKNLIQRILYKSFISTILSEIKKPFLILHRENF